jgi:hypothetical protein
MSLSPVPAIARLRELHSLLGLSTWMPDLRYAMSLLPLVGIQRPIMTLMLRSTVLQTKDL